MKFRKKPVVIEAAQLTPEACWDCWLNRKPFFGVFHISGNYHPQRREISSAWVMIDTLEGAMRADLGDWIICGVKGEYYPCKPDIFALTYEDADAPDPRDTLEAENARLRDALEQTLASVSDALTVLGEHPADATATLAVVLAMNKLLDRVRAALGRQA